MKKRDSHNTTIFTYEKISKYIAHNVLPNRFYLRLQKGK